MMGVETVTHGILGWLVIKVNDGEDDDELPNRYLLGAISIVATSTKRERKCRDEKFNFESTQQVNQHG
jgi:hypothetical protein